MVIRQLSNEVFFPHSLLCVIIVYFIMYLLSRFVRHTPETYDTWHMLKFEYRAYRLRIGAAELSLVYLFSL